MSSKYPLFQLNSLLDLMLLTFRLRNYSLHQSNTRFMRNHGNNIPNKHHLKFLRLCYLEGGVTSSLTKCRLKSGLQQSAMDMPWSRLMRDCWSAIVRCNASFINKMFSFLAWPIIFMLLHWGWCCFSQACSAMADLFVSPRLVAV